MAKLLYSFAVTLTASFFILGSGSFLTAQAEERAVLIVSEGEGQSPLGDSLYKDVVSRISEQVEQAGFNTIQATERLSVTDKNEDASLLARAREGGLKGQDGRKVAFVAVLSLFADMSLLNAGTRIRLAIKGRQLEAKDGALLAKFDLKLPENYTAPPECDRRCVIRLLQRNTNSIAEGLGRILADRLNERSTSPIK